MPKLLMRSKLFKSALFFFSFTSTLFLIAFLGDSVHAAEVTPALNITSGWIKSRTHVAYIEYSNLVVVDETTSIKLYENGVEVPVSHVINGSRLEITKSTYYLPHKTYRLVLQNVQTSVPDTTLADVDITFQYTSYRSIRVGKTVRGRNIMGYSLGEGSQVYLLIGAMHGNEQNTGSLVNVLLSNFKSHQDWIPDDSKLIFVPYLNADGYVYNLRWNMNKVDLNRNSNTQDWRRVTYWGYTRLPNGGGARPDSEPETKAIQSLMETYRPYMTISYHSAGNYVLTNGPLSRNFARSYAGRAQYRYVDQSSGGVAFTYPITGDLTIWAAEEGLRAITVELKSREWTEAAANLKAIRYVLSAY